MERLVCKYYDARGGLCKHKERLIHAAQTLINEFDATSPDTIAKQIEITTLLDQVSHIPNHADRMTFKDALLCSDRGFKGGISPEIAHAQFACSGYSIEHVLFGPPVTIPTPQTDS
jgi:hypothetical protein